MTTNRTTSPITHFCRFLCGLFLALISSGVLAEILDFNDFLAGPGEAMINPAGTTATLTEDENFNVSVLSLDPGLGDPDIIQEYDGSVLQFDYDFDFGPTDQDDRFLITLFDADFPLDDPLFSDEITTPQSGTIVIELSDFVGTLLGLEFRLQGPGGDVNKGSSVTLSNLEVTDAPPPQSAEVVSVPLIPAPLHLVLVIGLSLIGCRYWITNR